MENSSPNAFLRKSISRLSGIDDSGKKPLMVRRASFNIRSTFNASKYSDVLDKVKVEQDEEKDRLEDLRIRLKKFLSTSLAGKIYENFIFSISVISTIEFIRELYLERSIAGDAQQLYFMFYIQYYFLACFFIDWILNLFLADNKLSYIFRYFLFFSSNIFRSKFANNNLYL
jgi:hypothetical protein